MLVPIAIREQFIKALLASNKFSKLLLINSRRVVVNYKPKYVHKLLVTHLVQLAEEKSVVK